MSNGGIGPDELRALYVDFSKASRYWSRDEFANGSKLACVLHDFLVSRLLEVVRSHPDLPLLVSYQSDATSFLTHTRQLLQLGDHHVERGGKELSELLLERTFVKVSAARGVDIAAIEIAPPRVLSAGERDENLLTAANDSLPDVRRIHRGIAILHVSFDRAVFAGLSRYMQASQQAMHPEGIWPASVVDHAFGDMLDWFAQTACCYHDFHGGFKWGMMPHTSRIYSKFCIYPSNRSGILLQCLRNKCISLLFSTQCSPMTFAITMMCVHLGNALVYLPTCWT